MVEIMFRNAQQRTCQACGLQVLQVVVAEYFQRDFFIAGQYAGYCIITSDNPRTEDPEQILSDVEVGIKDTNCPYEKQVDRRIAIQRAVALAQAGDVILIAGKGHETYQIFPDKTIHFDDVEEVRKAFGEDCI